MWILVSIIAMVLIMGVNIGWQFRDWHWKRWLAKTDVICPKCKTDSVEENLSFPELIDLLLNVCQNCGYRWATV